MGPQGLCAAHDGAQVVGIGEAVDGHQQRSFTDLAATFNQAGQIQSFGSGALQCDALVHGTTGELAQAGPGHLLDQDP